MPQRTDQRLRQRQAGHAAETKTRSHAASGHCYSEQDVCAVRNA